MCTDDGYLLSIDRGDHMNDDNHIDDTFQYETNHLIEIE